jgi:hypothetical protein
MNWSSVRSWFASNGEARTAKFALPASVIEIAPGFVAGARFDGAGSRARTPRRMAVREIAPAAIAVSFNRPNIQGGEEVAGAVEAVKAVIGNGGASTGMLVPDGAVRTVILGFEKLPDDRREAEALIRWRVLDRLANPAEEVLISYQVLGQGPQGVELLLAAAKSSVLAGYLAALGLGSPPALILPSTVALLPLVPSEGEGGDLIVHVSAGWVSIVVLGGERVYMWRTRSARLDSPAEVGAEARRAAVSVHDRHQLEVRRIWLSVRPPVSTSIAAELEKALSIKVRLLEPPREMGKSLSTGEKETFQQFGAPIFGLLSNRD